MSYTGLDYKKASDSAWYSYITTELLYKLSGYGNCDDLWKWIRAYLTNRTQSVSISGQTSTFLPVVSGVLQGSLLMGQMFYIINIINDLFDSIKVAKPLLCRWYKITDGYSYSLHDCCDKFSPRRPW